MKRLLLLPAIVISLNALGQKLPLEEPKAHGGYFSFAFLPDGQTIAGGTGIVTAVINGKAVKPSGGEVILWDAKTGKIRKTLGSHEASVEWLAYSSDGSVLASASDENGFVKTWNLPGGSLRQTLKIDGKIGSSPDGTEMLCALAPNGKSVAAVKTVMEKVGEHSKRVGDELVVWDTSSGRTIWNAKDTNAQTLLVTPDSTLLVAATRKMQWEQTPGGLLGKSSDESLVAWDLSTGKERWRTPIKPWPAKVVFAQGRGIVAVSGKSFTLFDPSEGKKTIELKTASLKSPRLIVVAPDGSRFAAFEFMGRQIDWVDLNSGKITATQDFGKFHAAKSAISPDLKTAVMQIDFTPQTITLAPTPAP
jgi:WD40 repeat protein